MTRRIAFSLVVLLSCASLAVAQIKTPWRVRVSEGVMQGLLVNRVNPTYPPLARQARIQGTVVIRVQISTSGDVEKLDLVSGHPMLAPAAIEAVKQWKYKPYLMSGEPIAVETQVQVNFTLSDNPPAEGVAAEATGAPAQGTTGAADSGAPLAAPPQRVRVGQGVMETMIIRKVQPQYPLDAQHIQGVVVLKAIIDKEGNVSRVDLISGHPLLAPAAIEAVRQWKYKPFKLNNEPVEVETQVQVNFTLLGK